MLFNIIFAIHILLCVCLVLLVLLQEGKDLGSTFGAGGANTIFGAAGIDKPIVRATTVVAILFMFSAIILVNLFSRLSVAPSTAALPDELQRLNQSVQAQSEAAKAAPDAEKAAPAPQAESNQAAVPPPAPAPQQPNAENNPQGQK